MQQVHTGPAIGLASVVALVSALTMAVGLGPAGWSTGVGCAVVALALIDRAMWRSRTDALGPASRVTLGRLVLACGVAGLVGESFADPAPAAGSVAVMTALATVALALDTVDGRVARRTGTVSALGARFDMEVDAFLILVLSLYVAPRAGWWVLAIGAARYALVLARRLAPRLRRPVPPRRWCKVVAAVQGVVLTVVASGALPMVAAVVMLAVALLLLAESFGREAWESWRATAPSRETAELEVAGVGRG